MTVFCTLFKPRTSIKGICTDSDGYYQVLCCQNFDMCLPAVFSRSQRSLVSGIEEQENQISINQTEAGVHETLAKINAQTKLETKSKNLLRPHYGVGFQFRGQLYGSLERFQVHINVYWKSFVLPRFQWNLQSFQDLCKHQDQLVRAICQDFVPLVEQAVFRVKKYSTELETKLLRLASFITGNLEQPRVKPNRIKQNVFFFDSLRASVLGEIVL